MDKIHDAGIVVLTNDIDKTQEGYKPDKISYMRLEAAAIEYHWLLENGVKPYIVISGGRIRPGPTLAEVLAETAIQQFQISIEDLCKEEKSLNTVENAIFSVEELVKQNISNCYVVTNEFQLGRALDCFYKPCIKNYITLDGYSAESIIVCKYPDRMQDIENFKKKKDTQRRYKHNQRHRIIMNIPLVGPLLLRYGVRVQMALLGQRPQEHVLDE